MAKVRVLGLRGCSLCESLKAELYERDIKYLFIDADESGKLADEVESLLDTQNYPIVILEDINKVTYFYLPESSSDLGQKQLTEHTSKVGLFSVGDIAGRLKSY